MLVNASWFVVSPASTYITVRFTRSVSQASGTDPLVLLIFAKPLRQETHSMKSDGVGRSATANVFAVLDVHQLHGSFAPEARSGDPGCTRSVPSSNRVCK
jgi:hypothetical protein